MHDASDQAHTPPRSAAPHLALRLAACTLAVLSVCAGGCSESDSSSDATGAGGSASSTGSAGHGGAATPASCGDGQTQSGEQCDDGNTTDTDDCTNTCEIARCGDGIVWDGVEACDGDESCDETCCPTDQVITADTHISPGSYQNQLNAVAIAPGGDVAIGGFRGATLVTSEAWFSAPFGSVSIPGDDGAVTDLAYLSDGSLVVIGWSDALGGVSLRSFEPEGAVRWEQTRTTMTTGSGHAEAVAVDANDAIYTLESDGELGVWFVRQLAPDGTEGWRYEEAAAEPTPVYGGDLEAAAGGGVIAGAGQRLRKLDDTGALVWSVDIGGLGDDQQVLAVVELSDGTVAALMGVSFLKTDLSLTTITAQGVAGEPMALGREGYIGGAVADGNEILLTYSQSGLVFVARVDISGQVVGETQVSGGRGRAIARSDEVAAVVGSRKVNAQVGYGVRALLCP